MKRIERNERERNKKKKSCRCWIFHLLFFTSRHFHSSNSLISISKGRRVVCMRCHRSRKRKRRKGDEKTRKFYCWQNAINLLSFWPFFCLFLFLILIKSKKKRRKNEAKFSYLMSTQKHFHAEKFSRPMNKLAVAFHFNFHFDVFRTLIFMFFVIKVSLILIGAFQHKWKAHEGRHTVIGLNTRTRKPSEITKLKSFIFPLNKSKIERCKRRK